jgi:hypothetical protein
VTAGSGAQSDILTALARIRGSVGPIAPIIGSDDAVFTLAAEVAGLTHGHPSGFLSAGHPAVMAATRL